MMKFDDQIWIDFGTKNWVVIATRLGTNRTGKQCRERWVNQLDPSICKEVWSPEEERILTRAHEKYGNKWAKIAKLLPGRSDNACKNKINGAIKRHQKQKVTDVTKKNISLSSPKKNKGASKKTSSKSKKSSLDKNHNIHLLKKLSDYRIDLTFYLTK